MAIIFENDEGYFLCHRKYSQEVYGTPYREIFFDIRTPFLKNLEAVSIANSMDTGIIKNKKRKRPFVSKTPIEESDVVKFLDVLSDHFREPPTGSDFRENNNAAREASNKFLVEQTHLQNSDFILAHCNLKESVSTLTIDSYGKFVLPKNSQFFRNKIEHLDSQTLGGKKFSLIVIDPPWNNRFIKRKREERSSVRSYSTMYNDLLSSIPIQDFCHENSLVAIWCTNSESHCTFLKETLLPQWNLSYITTWYWIKVTRSGSFVCPWHSSNGKHPFERLVLARYGKSSSETLPLLRYIVSVPCAIHSFKPPLERVLKPFVQDGECLELFARSLMPNTVSWGDQLPLLQHESLFENPELI